MSVLTEYELRSRLRGKDLKEYEVTKGVIVTPSAKQYLQEKNIKLVVIEDRTNENKSTSPVPHANDESEKIFPKYICPQGGYIDKKPEHMTQLYGNKLVNKDNKRIILRGKLDSLQSRILEVQVLANKLGNAEILNELEEILGFVRNILKCEVLGEKLDKPVLLGMNDEELREISHEPKKYLNINHILPNYKMGELVVALNSLRSDSRQVEICAYSAFKNEEGEVSREDIVRSLNRLSSCFYIMMCKLVAGKYK